MGNRSSINQQQEITSEIINKNYENGNYLDYAEVVILMFQDAQAPEIFIDECRNILKRNETCIWTSSTVDCKKFFAHNEIGNAIKNIIKDDELQHEMFYSLSKAEKKFYTLNKTIKI
jgi:hypothetical protein